MCAFPVFLTIKLVVLKVLFNRALKHVTSGVNSSGAEPTNKPNSGKNEHVFTDHRMD